MGNRQRVDEQPMNLRSRHYAYAACSDTEYAVIKRFARREGLTVSDFVRRCINAWLLEEGDDVPLLAEYKRDRVDDLRGEVR